MRGDWTEDRVEKLKKLWAGGVSASLIASRLGGVTRNGVIGKIDRLGLSGRVPRRVRERAQYKAPRVKRNTSAYGGLGKNIAERRGAFAKPTPLPKPREDINEPVPLNLSLMDLWDATENRPGTCKWARDDEAPYRFCGHATFDGSPWCEYHYRICYQPASAQRSRQKQAEKDLAA